MDLIDTLEMIAVAVKVVLGKSQRALLVVAVVILAVMAGYGSWLTYSDGSNTRPPDLTVLLQQDATPIRCILEQGETKYIVVEHHDKLWAVALPPGVPQLTQDVSEAKTCGGEERSDSILYFAYNGIPPIYDRLESPVLLGSEYRMDTPRGPTVPYILNLRYRTIPS